MVWDRVLKICTLCRIPSSNISNYNSHFESYHSPNNPEECVVPECGCRFKSTRALNLHMTKDHKMPDAKAILEDGQVQIWAERVKLQHNNDQIGMYVGKSKLYHAFRAACQRDNEDSHCVIVDFESEGLCQGDHRSARKLFLVERDGREEGETDEQHKMRFKLKVWAHKVYARQHFLNSIYSNYRSQYELSTEQKEMIHDAIQKSDLKDQYSKMPQRSLIYREWRKSDVGRIAREKTVGFKPLAKWKDDDDNDDDKQPLNVILVELTKNHSRDAIREQLDILSQEEKIRGAVVVQDIALKRTTKTVGNSSSDDDDDDDFKPMPPKRKSVGKNSSSFN